MSDVHRLVQRVEAARAMVVASVHGWSTAQGAWKPAPDAWSAQQVIEHLFLAEVGGITKIWAAADEVRAGKAWTGELPHRGKPIEQVVEETWGGTVTAPQVATPFLGGTLDAWVAALRTLTPMLAALGARLEGVDLETVVFPHALSGPLDARQRLEFLRFHMDRHRAQIGRIRESAGFPAS